MKNKGKRAKRHLFCSYYSITFSTIYTLGLWLSFLLLHVYAVVFWWQITKTVLLNWWRRKKRQTTKRIFFNFLYFLFNQMLRKQVKSFTIMTINNNCVGEVNIEMKRKIFYYPASMNETFIPNLAPLNPFRIKKSLHSTFFLSETVTEQR